MKLLNEILGTKYPIIQGGMANIATGEFAAACSNAGALGLIGSGGMDADTLRENIRCCRALTDKVETSFILDTLLYLSKGGRCSSLTAFSAGLLNIKPCIEVKGGKMGVGKKYRGRMEQVLTNYVTERLRGREDIDLSRIFITYSSTTPVYYEAVKKAILDCQPFAEILPTSAGSTVSNHCGPLCLGILYMTKE